MPRKWSRPCLDLFVDTFNALDKRANAIAWDSCRVCHARSFFQEGNGIATKVTEKLTEPPRMLLTRSVMLPPAPVSTNRVSRRNPGEV
jgi:hypothetical protein